MKYDINNLHFRDLTAEELNVKVSTCSQYGSTFLLYKDARVDAQILNETVGAGNWMNDHKQVKDTMFCGISIKNLETDEWITKWDAGVPSFAEAEKGEASDSFKRAGFKWGIGTKALYNSPDIKIKSDVIPVKERAAEKYTLQYNESLRVLFVEYKNGLIDKLIIERKDPSDFYKWHECFRYPKAFIDETTTTETHTETKTETKPTITKPATTAPSAPSAPKGKLPIWEYKPFDDSKYPVTYLSDKLHAEVMSWDNPIDIKKLIDHWQPSNFPGEKKLGISKAKREELENRISELSGNIQPDKEYDYPTETEDDLPF